MLFHPIFYLDKIVDQTHIDGLGHVNNVRYAHWAEELAWGHSVLLGMDLVAYQALDAAMVARKHTFEYLAACFVGDVLKLKTWLCHQDALYLTRRYEIRRVSDDKLVFQGSTDWVCIRISTGRPMRMPVEFTNSYGANVVTGD